MRLKVFLRNSPDLVQCEYITQERAGEPEDVRCSQAFLRERKITAGIDEGAMEFNTCSMTIIQECTSARTYPQPTVAAE